MQNSMNTKKKGRILYKTFVKSCLATIAFFFALFSFGNFAHAAVIYSNTTNAGNATWSSMPVVPTGNGVIRHVRLLVSANSALNGQYLVASLWCFNNSSCSGAYSGQFNDESQSAYWSEPILYSGTGTYDFYWDNENSEVLDYTQFSTARSLVISVRHFDTPPSNSTDWGNANGYMCQYGNCAYDGTNTNFTNFGSTPNVSTIIDGEEPAPDEGVIIDEPDPADFFLNNPIVFSGTYTNGGNYNQLQLELVHSQYAGSINVPGISLPQIAGENIAWNTSRNLPFGGEYTLRARLWDSFNATGTAYTSPRSFTLISSSTVSTTTQSNLPGDATPLDCSTFDVGCYIKNAFMWAFFPSDDTISQFENLNLRGRFPFEYGFEAAEVIEEILSPESSTSTVISVQFGSFGDITLLSEDLLESIPLSEQVRQAIEWLCWIGLIFVIYKRIMKVHDSQTNV